LSKRLPVDLNRGDETGTNGDKGGTGRDPWLLHSLDVNALNFCAFAVCQDLRISGTANSPAHGDAEKVDDSSTAPPEDKTASADDVPFSSLTLVQPKEPSPILLAVPNALNTGGVDLFHLPSERRLTTIPASASPTTGMVMALAIIFSNPNRSTTALNPATNHPLDPSLLVIAGYESGHTSIYSCQPPSPLATSVPPPQTWKWNQIYTCKPHSQPILSLAVSPSPPGSTASHQHEPYYITTSADSLLAKNPLPSHSHPKTTQAISSTPLKISHTHHASQQSVCIRSDGKVFATAGWDGRVRVYGTKGEMREKAVLKWHKDGIYAVSFGVVSNSDGEEVGEGDDGSTNINLEKERREGEKGKEKALDDVGIRQVASLGSSGGALEHIKARRKQKAQMTHWLAAGGKDGKVSLWDIF
jgi:ASTRA-associated protein 1